MGGSFFLFHLYSPSLRSPRPRGGKGKKEEKKEGGGQGAGWATRSARLFCAGEKKKKRDTKEGRRDQSLRHPISSGNAQKKKKRREKKIAIGRVFSSICGQYPAP